METLMKLIRSHKAAGFASISADGIALIDEMTRLETKLEIKCMVRQFWHQKMYNCIKFEEQAKKGS